MTKGDPLDVAAYCAFAWHHGWPTATDDDRKEVERVNKLLEDLKAVFAKHTTSPGTEYIKAGTFDNMPAAGENWPTE